MVIYKGIADSSSVLVLLLLSLMFSSSFFLATVAFRRSKALGSYKATKRHLWLEEALKIN